MRRSSAAVGAGVVSRSDGDLRLPARRRPHVVERRAGMDRVEAHLAGLVEVPDPEVRDDDRRPSPEPALLAPDPLRVRGAARGSRRTSGSRSVSTNERVDWRMITKTWRALIAISHAPPLPGSRVAGLGVVADHGRVDVPEPVDLGGAQEPDVDQPALQVEAEQLVHAHDRRRAGDDRRVADAQRKPRRPSPEDAGLVDELEVRASRSASRG